MSSLPAAASATRRGARRPRLFVVCRSGGSMESLILASSYAPPRLLLLSAAARSRGLRDAASSLSAVACSASPRLPLLSVAACSRELPDAASSLPVAACSASPRLPLLFTAARSRGLPDAASSLPKSGRRGGGQVYHICGDGVGPTVDGDVFAACDVCGFPVYCPCYEYERKDNTPGPAGCRQGDPLSASTNPSLLVL